MSNRDGNHGNSSSSGCSPMKAYKQAKRNDAKTTAKLKQSVTDSYQSQTDTSPSASSLANHNASQSPLPNQNAASNHVTYPDDEIVQKEMYSASMNKIKVSGIWKGLSFVSSERTMLKLKALFSLTHPSALNVLSYLCVG